MNWSGLLDLRRLPANWLGLPARGARGTTARSGPALRLAAPRRLRNYFRYHGLLAPAVRVMRQVDFRTKSLAVAAAFLLPLGYLTALQGSQEWRRHQEFQESRQAYGLARMAEALTDALNAQRLDILNDKKGASAASDPRLEAAIEAALRDFRAGLPAPSEGAVTSRLHREQFEALAARVMEPGYGSMVERAQLRTQLIRLVRRLAITELEGSPLGRLEDPVLQEFIRLGTHWLPDMEEHLAVLGRRVLRSKDGGGFTAEKMRDYADVRFPLERALEDGGISVGRLKVADDDTLLSELTAAIGEVRQLTGQLDGQFTGTATAADVEETTARVAQTVTVLKQLEERTEARIVLGLAHLEAAWHWRLAGLLSLVGGGLLLAAYVLYSFYHVMRGGMEQIQREVDRMSRGDLSGRPRPLGTDDVARTLLALHESLARLADLFSVVRRGVGAVSHASSEIASASQDLATSTQQSVEASQAVEQGIGRILDHLDHNDQLVQHAVDYSREMTTDAGRSRRAMAKLSDRIDVLQSRSREIGKIVGMIDAIAFQTNLLSLNASVEASKAGAAGKGFAVVAHEVRQLASRVSEAGQQINRIVATSIEEIEQGHEIASHTLEAVSSTERNAKEVNTHLARLAALKREGQENAERMSNALNEVRRTTDSNAELVAQMATAAGELRSQSLRLSEQSARFKLT